VSNLNRKGRSKYTITLLQVIPNVTIPDLQSFREALVILQRQVDELDEIKSRHYQEIIDHEDAVWNTVQAKTSVIVRSTMDVFDRLTSKAYVIISNMRRILFTYLFN
jgi:hypothetical protein